MVKSVAQVMDIEEDSIQKVDDNTVDGFIGIIKKDKEIINIIDIEILLSKNEGFI